MIKKTMTYTDFNGVERTEDFYFNLTKAELLKMEMGIVGGLTEKITRIIAAKDQPTIIAIFEELIQNAYGVKTADGRGFVKRKEDLDAFISTQAYSDLYMELATDDKKAADFINGIIPPDLNQDKTSHPALKS